MELRQLRIFVAVAEELHFRRAAERVGMAQAALSAQVRALEDELGFPLLFRTTRHVSLTQAGSVFLNEARAVLERADAAVETARAAAAGGLSRLRIGGIDAALVWFLPPVLARFRARFPGVHAPLTEVTASVEQGFELLRHRVDVGFFRAPAADDAIAWEPLLAERVVAAMPAGHPLAARSAIGVSDLAAESLIGYPRHARPVLHAMLWDAFRAAGLRPRVGFEAVEKATLLRLVAQGLGIGLVPQWVTLAPAPGVVFRPFADAAAPMRLGVGWRRAEDGETLRTFLALVREHARTTQAVLDAQAF
jgi:DNA-binding transcriptional LysR family regulator